MTTASISSPTPSTPSASPVGTSWKEVDRLKEVADIAYLPRFMVLAALPGWGRTTWMVQLTRRARAASYGYIWLASRDAVERFIAHSPSDPSPNFVFIDDILLTDSDPLWTPLAHYAAAHEQIRFVVSTIDIPSISAPTGLSIAVRSEDLLSFRPREMVELFELNGAHEGAGAVSPSIAETPRTRALQCPAVARSYIEGSRGENSAGGWPRLVDHSGISILDRLRKLPREAWATSTMLRLLYEASGFRRASAQILDTAHELFHPSERPLSISADDETDESDVIAQGAFMAHFERLAALPLGTMATDQESGQRMFEWDQHVWEEIRLHPLHRRPWVTLAEASEASSHAGYSSLRLYYELEQGCTITAEADANRDLRYWLISADDITYEKIWSLPWDVLSECPSLLLLLGELHIRRTGSLAQSRRFLVQAVRGFEKLTPDTPSKTFQILSRKLFAYVLLGERRKSERLMHVVWEMLGDGPENIVAELVKDDDDRERFAANLYPALWAAIQLDRHLPALAITQLMSTYANPSSPTHMIEQLTALTEEILCGLGDPNRHLSADGLAHSDPVALVDVGRDADAAELLRVFATHLGTAPSRSAAEGFLLLGRTLTGPEQLTPDMINETVQRSRDFWSDQESSTFICLAASLAYLALGDPTKGREVLSYAYRTDWFIRAATAITALAEKNPSLVLSTLSRGTKLKDSPRAKAMLNVVAAAAFLQLGNPTAALRRLENLSSFEEMRLARFAFRFLTVEDFDALTEISMSLPSTLQDAFTQGARDPKVFARIASVSLTPTEYELLGLLHEGHTNSKIASIRVVSINTVRSQMRTLYKKIGAENRREAIAFAERQGIFGASVPEED